MRKKPQRNRLESGLLADALADSYGISPRVLRQCLSPATQSPPLPGGGSILEASAPSSPNCNNAFGILSARVHSISGSIIHTLVNNRDSLERAIAVLQQWITQRAHVRILGAGRALLAVSMAANRLSHAGATISYMGGILPPPDSLPVNGIISSSASGKTVPVIEAMREAKSNNPNIAIIGLAAHDAMEFGRLCDVFIGLHIPKTEYRNPLAALADTEEQMIAEITDALVVLAGLRLGFSDAA